MQNLDGTIIVTALPAMATSFATTASRMSEGITACAPAAAVCIPASAWLADRMGTRNLFCAAIALFTLAVIPNHRGEERTSCDASGFLLLAMRCADVLSSSPASRGAASRERRSARRPSCCR